MISERDTTMTVAGTLTGDRVIMGIEQGAMAHIMQILTDLYSDPELAIIREYSTNALDAHVEAGNSAPIQVDLPTPLSPFLRIRDFGIGLSAEDIHEIYSQYGASTKRGTNDQVGMLGLGCKSALTYADQFTLVSVKDGYRAQVSISRDDDGGGSMTIVDVSSTSDPNGTEIVIPAKRANAIEAKAKEFFSYWKAGTVLVNGKQPEPIDGLHVTERLIVKEGDYYQAQDYVVMGNVAYPTQINVGLPRGQFLIAYVDIGSVNFTPSREALHDTDKTRATLDAVRADFKVHAYGAIQREIDKATCPAEAVKIASRWHSVLNHHGSFSYTFKGKQVPYEFAMSNPDQGITVVPINHYILSRHQVQRTVLSTTAMNALWAYGYDRPKFTAGQKKKINQWMQDSGIDANFQSIILTKEKPPADWIAQDRIVKWETIQAVKLPRAAVTRSGRLPGSYDLYAAGALKKGVAGDDINQTKPVFYFDTREPYIEQEAVLLLNEAHPGCTIVVLHATRVAKFCRNVPTAIEVRTAVKTLLKAWAKKLTTDTLYALALQDTYTAGIIRSIEPGKIDDPALKRAAKLAKTDLTKLMKERRMFRTVLGHDAVTDKRAEIDNPLDPYPLFDQYKFQQHQQHTYDYLNCAYARKESS